MAIMRSYNDPRGVPYGNMDIQRSMVTASFPGKPGQPVGPMVNFQLRPGPIVQKTQYPIEHLTVESFLHSLGLQKYMISFRVEEVHKVLKGLPPIRSLLAIGSSAAKLVSLPVKNYKKDGRLGYWIWGMFGSRGSFHPPSSRRHNFNYSTNLCPESQPLWTIQST